MQCNNILGKIISSIDPEVLLQEEVSPKEDGFSNLGLVIFMQNAQLEMDTNQGGSYLRSMRSQNFFPKNTDMLRNVAEIMQILVLDRKGRSEIDTVAQRNDEDIRVPLHLVDGSMLKNRMVADRYSEV